jgi:lycopene beta-cyclase
MEARQKLIFVGGGLANSLAAFRLSLVRPEIDWVMIEKGPSLGGQHTWCCHGSDLSPTSLSWLAPLITKEWARHEVRFPSGTRLFDSPYLALRSHQFDRILRPLLGKRVRLHTNVIHMEANRVTLDSGEVIEGARVIDGRGLESLCQPMQGMGYQKFRGLFLTTSNPHGLSHPIVMDATVQQKGGYRFFYILPWSQTELLVEDTYYDESTTLPGPEKDADIMEYVRHLGIGEASVTAVEHGLLPIPLFGAKRPQGHPQVISSGLAAGLFHPTTGYSLPDAVRFADWFSEKTDFSSPSILWEADHRAEKHWRRGQFYRRLNNMLFRAAPPPERYKILAAFHEHDAALIARFYAFKLQTLDPLRILRRKPDISLTAAMRAFFKRVAYDN